MFANSNRAAAAAAAAWEEAPLWVGWRKAAADDLQGSLFSPGKGWDCGKGRERGERERGIQEWVSPMPLCHFAKGFL